MRSLGVLLLAMAMTGCVPIFYGARYEKPSRQNLSDAVPAFIEAGRTSMADVVLTLGDPDTVAADESWIAYASTYREGGGGAALILGGGGQVGMLGGARKRMLYRRLLVRFDGAGLVQEATLDVVDCAEADYFLGQSVDSSRPCFDVTSRDLVALDLARRRQHHALIGIGVEAGGGGSCQVIFGPSDPEEDGSLNRLQEPDHFEG